MGDSSTPGWGGPARAYTPPMIIDLREQITRAAFAVLAASAAPAVVHAQSAPANTAGPAAQEAQALAKYDRNNNGVLDPDEARAMNADSTAGRSAATATDDIVAMSPFTVSSEKDVGYYAENTLAGSRLKTNLSDLGASITVVTKQQMEDTGAIDINDVFMYEANTEGANTYTPVRVNRGTVVDSIGGWVNDSGSPFGSNTANRVRGLGAADTAQNNYPTISRLPLDTYNANSMEISRGPNSMLFGTGSPAGIVNQSTAEAALGKYHTTVTARFGRFDEHRASLSANVPIGEKFAVYAAALYDSRGFQRKPSSDIYRRQYASATWRPFSGTKLTASYEHYDNFNNRPNALPPQDFVTPWRNAGRPGWNPVTQMVTFQDTGRSVGPYLVSTRDTRYVAGVTGSQSGDINFVSAANVPGPLFIGGIQFMPNRPTLVYDNAQLMAFTVTDATSGGTTNSGLPADAGRTQAQREMAARRLTFSNGFLVPRPAASTGATGYVQWLAPQVTDKGIYDWEKYSTFGANYGTQNAYTYNVELQQQIFTTPLHNMYFSGGWFRQEFDEWVHYPLGQANQAARLYVDTNLYTIDGRPNPYFGSPFVFDSQADSFYQPETNDNKRAMLAYEIDLSRRTDWARWLGRHRLLGLASQQDQWANSLRYRLSTIAGDPRFLPANANTPGAAFSWAGNSANLQRVYYLGHNSNGVVEQGLQRIEAPGFGGPTSGTLSFYDWQAAAFRQTNLTFRQNLGYLGNPYGVSTRKTSSKSVAWQGWLWQDRLLPTIGWRRDVLKMQNYTGRNYDGTPFTVAQQYTNGDANPGLWNVLGTATYTSGNTMTRGGVIRPLKGWRAIEESASGGSFLGQLARGLTVHYNTSDNFNAPSGIVVDFFNNHLPTPSGEGKDYGFGLNLLDDRLVLRMNWYKATNRNQSSAVGNTVTGRLTRIDAGARLWATYVVRMRHGQDPAIDANFANNTVNPLTPQMQAEISRLQWGSFPLGDFNWPLYDGSITATETYESKGKEFSATFNPSRAWTMKLTVGQQKARASAVGPEVTEWIKFRRPQWEALTSEFTQDVVKASNGNRLQLGSFWTGYGFTDPADGAGAGNNDAPSTAQGGTGNMQTTYTQIVESQYLPMLAQARQLVPGEREWSASYLTSYTFQTGRLKGVTVGGSVRWQDKAFVSYQGLLDPTTYVRPSAGVANIVFPDFDRPIYSPAQTNIDLWASYSMKLTDKVRMKVQLNVRDVAEKGGLETIYYNMDGSPAQYRIKNPRTWYLTTTFDF